MNQGQDNLTIVNSNNDDEDFLKAVNRRFLRARNTKEKLVVLANVTSVDTQKGITPADSDLRELRQDIIRELAATIDVPPFVVGATSDTTYNNITARTIAFYSESIVPLVNIIKTEMSHTLQEEVTTDLDDLLAGDPATLVDMLIKKAGGPYMSVDEAREKDNLPKMTPDKLKKSVRNAPGASSPKPGGQDNPPGVDKRDEKPEDDRRGRDANRRWKHEQRSEYTTMSSLFFAFEGQSVCAEGRRYQCHHAVNRHQDERRLQVSTSLSTAFRTMPTMRRQACPCCVSTSPTSWLVPGAISASRISD